MYLKDGEEYKEVVSIGNMDVKEILKHISSMQAYETNAYLKDCLNSEINNQFYYEMLKIAQEDGSLNCVVDNNGEEEHVTINPISHEKYVELEFDDNSPFYSHEMLEDNILLIKYRACVEHKDYPFTKFVEEVKQQIKSKNISQYVLDLRGNHGGDSSIIRSLTSY